jgi:Holliday junction resolvase
MGNKEKGANTERELYQMFIDNCYRAVRVAGSGMLDNTSCDLIAGKEGKKFCIEVKASKKPCKYITKKQIEEFMVFATIFGLEPVVAVRFNREGWFFLKPEDLEDSGKHWKVDLDIAREKGRRFGQAFG